MGAKSFRSSPAFIQVMCNAIVFTLVVAVWFYRRENIFPRPRFYDIYGALLGSVAVGQLSVVSLWNALLEPRSPRRWLHVTGIAMLFSAIVALCCYLSTPTYSRILADVPIDMFSTLLLMNFLLFLSSRVLSWPIVQLTSMRLEYRHAAAPLGARRFSLSQYLLWTAAVSASLWLIRELFSKEMHYGIVVATAFGLSAVPIAVAAALVVFAPRPKCLLLLTLTLLVTSLVELRIAWYRPISWPVFSRSVLVYNGLLAVTVAANFIILRSSGLRIAGANSA